MIRLFFDFLFVVGFGIITVYSAYLQYLPISIGSLIICIACTISLFFDMERLTKKPDKPADNSGSNIDLASLISGMGMNNFGNSDTSGPGNDQSVLHDM